MSSRRPVPLGPRAPLRALAILCLSVASFLQPVHADEGFRQTLWASTNHGVHAFDADTGAPLIDAARDPQARSIDVDLRRGVVWVYGQGRLSRHGLDGALEQDVDVPGTSPGDSASNGNGNGGERLQDLEVSLSSGEVWLGVKRRLYRFAPDGALLDDWTLDADVRGLALDGATPDVWLLTRDDLFRVAPGAAPEAIDLPLGKPFVELSAAGDGALWLVSQDHVYRVSGDGDVAVEAALAGMRQIVADAAGGAWVADDKALLRLDAQGVETARFDHTVRGRTVDLELDPRDGTPWLASQQDIAHYDGAGNELLVVPVKDVAATARYWDIEPGIDATPPRLAFLSPEPGACLGTARPELALSYSDAESGVDPDTLTLFHDGTTLPAECAFVAESASCTPDEALPEGDQTILAEIADHAGNVSAEASLTLHIDTIAPEITVANPADGSETFDGGITITGRLSEPVPLTVNGDAVELDGDLSFDFEVALDFGENVFTFEAVDCAGNESQVSLSIVRNRSPPEFVSTPVIEVKATQLYRYDSHATDPDPDDVLEYSVTGGPAGLAIDAESGLVEWQTTEDDVGDHPVSLKVTDLNGDYDVQEFVITVLPNNLPPEVVTNPVTHVPERADYSYDVDAVDPNEDLLRYSLTMSSSPSLHIDATSGLIEGHLNLPPSSIRVRNRQCRSSEYSGVIDPVVKWSWSGSDTLPHYNQVMSVPLVAQLTDDNGDGVVTTLDTPDIVALTYNEASGGERSWSVLRAFSGDDGSEIFVTSEAYLLDGYGAPAIGDLEGDGTVEIVAPNYGNGITVFDRTGAVLWRSEEATDRQPFAQTITLADLDADGSAEIISGDDVLDHEGTLLWTMGDLWGSNHPIGNGLVSIGDIDSDGLQEVVAGPSVYEHDGNIKWQRSSLPDGFTGIADVNLDGAPEIVLVANSHVYLLDHTGEVLWSFKAFHDGARGGAPTIGNFDGDSEREIGVAGGSRYVAIDSDGTLIWSSAIQDQSSNTTSSTVFDFNGDGIVEVLYADEKKFRIYRGTDGETLYSLELSSGTAYEYPVVADVDNDNQAEIVVPTDQLLIFYGAEPSPGTRGLRVLESQSGSWVPTRGLWNQHAYSISNIEDDGSIPATPVTSWLTHNTYRLNTFSDGRGLGKPELALFDLLLDEEVGGIDIVVENRGLVSTEIKVQLQLFDGDPANGGTLLGEAAMDPIAAGSSAVVTIGGIDPLSLVGPVYALIDPNNKVTECLEANNAAVAEVMRARATDPGSLFDRQTWLVNVVNVNEAPQILTESLPAASPDTNFHTHVQAADPDLGDDLRFELVSGPEALRLNEVNGRLTWLADYMDVGTYPITVRVVDLGGLTDQRNYILKVEPEINNPPDIITEPVTQVLEDAQYTYDVDAIDPDGDLLSYGLLQDVPQFDIEPQSGNILGRIEGILPNPVPEDDPVCSVPSSFLGTYGDVLRYFGTVPTGGLSGQLRLGGLSDDTAYQLIQLPTRQLLASGVIDRHQVKTLHINRGMRFVLETSEPVQAITSQADSGVYPGTGTFFYSSDGGFSSIGYQFFLPGTRPERSTEMVVIVLEESSVAISNLDGEELESKSDMPAMSVWKPDSLKSRGSYVVESSGRALVLNNRANGNTRVPPIEDPGCTDRDKCADDAGNRFVFGTFAWGGGALAVFNPGNDPSVVTAKNIVTGEIVVQDEVVEPGEVLYRTDLGTNYYELTATGAEVTVWAGDNECGQSPEYMGDDLTLNFGVEGKSFLLNSQTDGAVVFAGISPTTVRVNSGPPQVLMSGEMLDITPNRLVSIEADKPVTVGTIGGNACYFFNDWAEALRPAPDGAMRPVADLAVLNISFDGSNQLVATVKNRGATDLEGGSVLEILSLSGGTEYLIGKVEVPSMMPGEQVDLAIEADVPQNSEVLVGRVDSVPGDECHSNNNRAEAGVVAVKATDPGGLFDTQRFSVSIQDVNDPPVVKSTPRSQVNAAELFVYSIDIDDPDRGDSHSYELVEGPDSAQLDPQSGVLVWQTDESDEGLHQFRVRVDDVRGSTAEQGFEIEVFPSGNRKPYFTSGPELVATVGFEYTYDTTAVDPDGDALSYWLARHPSGMTIDNISGVIEWLPESAHVGTQEVIVRVADGQGGVGEQAYVLEVASGTSNQVPTINSAPLESAQVGQSYEYLVEAVDPDGDPLSYELITSPSGMTIDGAGGLIEWTPSLEQVGDYSVTVEVSDGRGGSARQSYTLTVTDGSGANNAPAIASSPTTVAAVDTEYTYQVEASDPDGDSLSYALTESPSGMTIDGAGGLVQWTPTADQIGEHVVTVEVGDGRGGVATQTYTLTVNEGGGANQPPGISSEPPLTARTGEPYAYQVQASDPDGDALSYALASAPSGMTISASGGLVEWSPAAADVGEHAVALEVRDGRGGVARQDFTLAVVDGSANNPPQILSAPPVDGKVGFEYRYPVVAEDPEGDSINYTLVDAPAGMTVDAAGEIRWTPDGAGDVPVTVRADDGQAYQQQTWTITVVSNDTELAVNVVADPAFVDPGEPVTVTVEASGMAGQYSLSANLDGEPLALDEANQAVVALEEIGEHQVTAALSDDFGSVTDGASFTVQDPDANPPPVVNLVEPGFEQEVTAPIDVVGSVDDDNLQSWVLAIRPRDNPNAQPQVLAEGDTVFAEQAIAPVDPTQLTNGLYTVILQATDLSGQTAFDSRVVRVTGDLKVGNFSITFEDVSIPLAGIPVRVTRTYDSRRRFESLDFGQGWSVDYQNGRVQESRTVGFGWDLYEYDRGFFSEWCVQPNGAPVVTVNLGDGDLRTFEAKAQPECQEFVPQVDVNIVFEPVDGTDAALEMTDYGLVRLVEGNIVDLGAPEDPIDPDHYRLTTADGMVYQLDQSFGVRKVIEPGGNEITFSEAGITHSSGVGVDFIRDTQGRISEILLPDGENLSYSYDANGDLVGMTDQLDQSATYTYDANFPHYLRDILDPRGVRVTRNEYDENGRLVATIDADGNRIEYDHDVEGRTSQIRDRRGNLTTYVYDDQGRVLAETNALVETTTHTYNAEGFELTRTDPLGNTTEWTVDERGNKLTETNALGQTTTMAYNARNRLLSQTAPDGTVVMANTYDPNSLDLTSTTDALGNTTTFTYDVGIGSGQTGQLLSTTDALGNETTYDYDFGGNYLQKETDPLGTATRYVRDSMGRVLEERTTRTRADGTVQELVTTHAYDAKGRRIQTTRPDGSVTTTTYNALDKVAERCDAGGHCTSYVYDDQGRRVQTTHPDGTTETVAYDAAGNEIARTDRAGRTTKMVYDAADRLIETIYPDDTPADDSDNPRETRDYDAAGRLVAVTDERGNTTSYEYDDAGRRTAVIDPLGHRTDFILDQRGRQVAVMDADGHVTRYAYDDAGRRTATTFADDTPSDDTDNPRVTTAYDALGRQVAETDEVGQTKRLKYDALGRLTEVIEPDPVTGETPLPSEPGGIRTRYTYDEQGNKLTQIDALGRTTRWTYDALGRVTSRELPLGQVETFQYDEAGNRVSKTDFAGQATTYDYDVMDRRVGIHAPDREVALSYTPTGLRSQVTVQPGSTGLQVGTTAWSYDARNRLTDVQYPDGQGIRYEYDAAGNRTTLETRVGAASAAITRYAFDALNRLSTVTSPAGGVTTYTYNTAGDLTRVAHPNGTEQVDTFDARHRLISRVNQRSDDTVITAHHYTLSDDNRRLALSEADGRLTEWTYDVLDRLIEERVTDPVRGDRTTTFEYDAVGNRLRKETVCNPSPCEGEGLGEGVVSYAYDDNDRLLSEVGPNGTTTYAYDANGNTIEKAAPEGLTVYDYNTDNRLISAQTPVHDLAFEYDIEGIRQSRTQDGALTDYLTDANRAYSQVIEERDGSGSLEASYVHGHDLLSQNRAGQASFYHTDGLGSTRALTSAAGAPTDTYGYTAYGLSAYETGSDENPYRYTGEQFDAGLGQYYLRARYYEPTVGRFSRRDEFSGWPQAPASLNKFAFVHANPVSFTDPSGRAITIGQLSIATQILGIYAIAETAAFIGNESSDAGHSNEHFYEFISERPICSGGMHCTRENVYELMTRFPAPSPFNPLDPPVKTGQRIFAYAWILPLGYVETTLWPELSVLRNTTIPWQHAMHNGTVTRSLLGSGSIRIKTVGEGVNFTPVIAFLNDRLGEEAFRALNRHTRRAYEQAYGDN